MRLPLYALVDCSAFYCSCERAFRPDLEGKPIVVLSNNDGCVISLTPDAKALGIPMGAPYYQIKDELRDLGVAVFSSNYCLYADMSRRVVGIIREYSDFVEQYSIDEAFVRFEVDSTHVAQERARMQALAEDMHVRILKGTGIPVRVSIAETKTLAKIGSDYTKSLLKEGKIPAVCFWKHPSKDEVLTTLPVGHVWGIGRRWSKKLAGQGILTAGALAQMAPKIIRKRFNIEMERTVQELNGIPCIPLDLTAHAAKSIIRSRMFSRKLTDRVLIAQSVSTHATRAAEKLRKENQVAGSISVFITTGWHAKNLTYSSKSELLVRPTNDTLTLVRAAERVFDRCFVSADKHGRAYLYSKAGVVLRDLSPASHASAPLFLELNEDKPDIMKVIDSLNKRFGKNSLVPASGGTPDQLKLLGAGKTGGVGWGMKREKMSARYTTVVSELLSAKL